jgi:LPS-assembly protein
VKRVVWVLFVAPVAAHAQISIPALSAIPWAGSPLPSNPLAPTDSAPLPPRDGTLPPPEQDKREFKLIRSGTFSQRGNRLSISGGTEFLAQGYRVFADTAEGDLGTNIWNLTGHVKVVGSGSVVNGERVTADLANRSYRAYDANTQLSPSLIKGQIKSDLYTKGRESFGTTGETRTYDGSVTTCDKPEPHFELEADDTVVRPGRRAIFRRAHLKVFGHTVLALPFLSVPLDDRTYNNLPQFGQSRDEGYFVKNRFGVPLKGDNFLNTRLDYMTKLGTGYGGEYGYESRLQAGLSKLYLISGDTNSLVLNNQHRQKFSFGSLSLENNYECEFAASAGDAAAHGGDDHVFVQSDGERRRDLQQRVPDDLAK